MDRERIKGLLKLLTSDNHNDWHIAYDLMKTMSNEDLQHIICFLSGYCKDDIIKIL